MGSSCWPERKSREKEEENTKYMSRQSDTLNSNEKVENNPQQSGYKTIGQMTEGKKFEKNYQNKSSNKNAQNKVKIKNTTEKIDNKKREKEAAPVNYPSFENIHEINEQTKIFNQTKISNQEKDNNEKSLNISFNENSINEKKDKNRNINNNKNSKNVNDMTQFDNKSITNNENINNNNYFNNDDDVYQNKEKSLFNKYIETDLDSIDEGSIKYNENPTITNQLIEKINKINKEEIDIKFPQENEKKNNEILKVNNSKKNELFYEQFFTDNESNFYDMILDFHSFEQLLKKDGNDGWTANFTIEGKKRYDESIKNANKNVVIGVVGKKNRGKSYLLGRIMDNKYYEPPSGFLVTTYGISCKFPILSSNEGKKYFVTLDTAGKDNPLLQNTFDNNENLDIKVIARDQKITEILLSDFIIQESNILIAVLEQLSYVEQDILKTLIERLRKKVIKSIERRKLIVIHNLMNISTVKDIKKFIEEKLLRSLTFELDPQSMGKSDDDFDDSDKFVYIQTINDENKDKLDIIHLIIGNDHIREIREAYNEPAFRYIRDHIVVETTKGFDIISSFKNYITKNANEFMSKKTFNDKSLFIDNEKKIKVSYLDEKNERKTIDKIVIPIKLNDKIKEFSFKPVYTNSGGIHCFLNTIEPRYSARIIEKNGKKYIEIVFEIAGVLKNHIYKIDADMEKLIITISGEVEEALKIKKIIKSEGTLEYSEFSFQVKIDKYDNENNEIDFIENVEKEVIEDFDEKLGKYKYLFPIDQY